MKISCQQLGNAGRLGNQLFQLASTLGIADRCMAAAQFPAWDYQPYFSVPEVFFGPIDPDAVDVITLVDHLDERARGYLQDYNLFKDIHCIIRRWLTPSALAEEILSAFRWVEALPRPLLAVHVRRGDNAYEGLWKAQYHPLRPMSYYSDALKGMAAIEMDRSVIIFSDDIPWCVTAFAEYENVHFFNGGSVRTKEHLPGYKTEAFNDWIDLLVMSWCDAHIISNSTYAWWAAFLSDSEHVMYPSPFFGPALNYIDASLMMPPNWTKVPHAT